MRLTRRRATAADIPRLVEMGREFARVTGESMPFVADAVAERMAFYLSLDNCLVQVLDDDGQAVGALGAICFPHYLLAPSLMASEMFWWVDPAYRGVGSSLRLIEDYEAWAREKGCVKAAFSMFVAEPRMRTLLERRGFRLLEMAFAKDL